METMSITIKRLQEVETELKRFTEAVRRLKKEQPEVFSTKDGPFSYGKYTGEVRRASMDLSRSLSRLRNPNE